ncbi:MAG: TRAP transporter small permease [Alphaproteobacteria bacterium]|nr:TRAP transporter small permease [Alphaproteobacteria bacterium]
MRAVLDGLYRASGALAAGFLALIAVTVLLQVGANVLDWAIGLATGRPLGLMIPSYSEFTGFFLVATSFLALGYTLGHGGHIRVSLIIGRFKGRTRAAIELAVCLVGAAAAAYFTFYAGDLTYDSWRFNDRSSGIVPAPLWIPQAGMTAGATVLAIALLDEAARILRGEKPRYAVGDDAEIPKAAANDGGNADKIFSE